MKRALFALLCSCLFVTGCAREHVQNAAVDTSAGPALFYPPGVLPPGDWASQRRDGIYSSDTAAQCCFLAGSATLTLDNPPNAQLAVFKFFVPTVKPLLAGTERVRVAFDGVQAGAPAPLSPGAHDVIFTIPASVRAKRHLVASIVMSVTWVPNKIGLNADRRELSVMLLRVGYI